MKKALVLSGGGSKGAYQAGALKHIVGNCETKYDILCGVSVGAINSAMLGMFKIGEEKEASNYMESIWLDVRTNKIYKRWCPFGRLHALWKPSLYNSKPLQEWIRSVLNVKKIQESDKEIRVGAVSLTTGEYKLFSEKYPDFAGAIIASSSFPGALLPIELDGELWSDGGVKEITPLQAAIDLGAEEIDVIMCSPAINPASFNKDPNAIDVLKRTVDLMSDEIIENDISKALMYNKLCECGKGSGKKVLKINVIRPEFILTDDSLDFSPNKIKYMMNIGYNDAKAKFK